MNVISICKKPKIRCPISKNSRCAGLAILALWTFPVYIAAQPTDVTAPTIKSAEWLPTAQGDENAATVASGNYPGREPSITALFSPNRQAIIWTRITVANPGPRTHDFSIESVFNFYEQSVYDPRTGTLSTRGYGMGQDRTTYRLPIHHITLEPGVNVFYSRTVVQFPLLPTFGIVSAADLAGRMDRETILIGSLFTVFIVMTLYNLFSSLMVRKTYYLSYFVYLLTTVLMNLCYLGVGYRVMGSLSWMVTEGWGQWVYLNMLSGTWFAIGFLRLKEDSHRLYRLTLIACVVISAGFLATFIVPLISMIFYNMLLIFLMFCFPIIGTYRAFRGFSPAVFFTVAWSVLLLSSFFFNLSVQNVLPPGLGMEWVYLLGAAAEMVLLSLALGDLTHFTEQGLLAKQRDYIDQLERERADKEHVYDQLEKIVYPHQIEWIEKGATLEETMPVGKREGIVIALDIVRSSTLPHDVAKSFFREFFSHCEKLMMRHYRTGTPSPSRELLTDKNEAWEFADLIPLECEGYRIKEMGDGFLCSVGFPFAPPPGQDMETSAFNLCRDFLSDFTVTADAQGLTGKIFCSIAMARGELEGFYPKAGTKEYDLYGKGIILASRYEAMRKRIFPETGCIGNILVLQTKIFETLPAKIREGFTTYAFGDRKIAEDPNAENLHYKII